MQAAAVLGTTCEAREDAHLYGEGSSSRSVSFMHTLVLEDPVPQVDPGKWQACTYPSLQLRFGTLAWCGLTISNAVCM